MRIEAAGAGLFPIAGALNATLTVHAPTECTAAHIAANWRGYAG